MSDPLGRHTNECDLCGGTGWVLEERKMCIGTLQLKVFCPQCNGKGYVVEDLDDND